MALERRERSRAAELAKRPDTLRGASALPVALNMTPTETLPRFDAVGVREQRTLLVEVVNAPRNGPGLIVNGDARMHDGLLDVQVRAGI